MKSNVYVEYQNNQYDVKTLSDKAKEQWKDMGKRVKDIQTLDVYLKPEEKMCYFAVNGEAAGSFPVEEL